MSFHHRFPRQRLAVRTWNLNHSSTLSVMEVGLFDNVVVHSLALISFLLLFLFFFLLLLLFDLAFLPWFLTHLTAHGT